MAEVTGEIDVVGSDVEDVDPGVVVANACNGS